MRIAPAPLARRRRSRRLAARRGRRRRRAGAAGRGKAIEGEVGADVVLDQVLFHAAATRQVEFAPGERVELLEGEIRAMSPVGPLHVSVVSRLIRLFAPLVGDRYQLNVQSPIFLSESSEPEPDLVLCYSRPDFYAARLPGSADIALLVEVSDTTLRYDRMEKLPLYAAAGIPEVWIVDVNARRIEQYHTPKMGAYSESRVLAEGDSITAMLGITFDLADVLGDKRSLI